ncbi:MAG: glycoside hydrolase family 13 protein [Lachnospiraceae bacterium]
MKDLQRLGKIMWYIFHTKPLLVEDALFSDGTEEYQSPMEPTSEDDVAVRIRTAKGNVDEVFVIYNNRKEPAVCVRTDSLFDYYEGIIPASDKITEYCFEVHAGNVVVFYNKKGVSRELNSYYNFKIIPDFSTPDWAKGSVMYQIFVDRFYNGDPTNDVLDREYCYIDAQPVVAVKDWNRYPSSMDVRDFYGGDLQGVMDKLDYLQGLGVETIYLNPIFVSPSNHKYDSQDYDHIDPHYGKIVVDEGRVLESWEHSNQNATKYISRTADKRNLEASDRLFAQLTEEIHKRGMKIILDGVFNHCGSFNKWMDREGIYKRSGDYQPGAYESEDSPYRSFFRFYNEHAWPDNASYDGWWGHDTLPKLNYEDSPKLQQYIFDIAKKWLLPPYNVDGWRLDVAADLGHSPEYNHQFWAEFRKQVKSVRPDALIIAEHYGDPAAWLQGREWDTVMNYDAFMEPFTWFFTGLEKHSDEYRADLYNNATAFFESMSHHMTRYSTASLQVSMNELSNHDHSRFLTRTNHRVGRTAYSGPQAANEGINKGIMREAVVAQMTWPGAPTVYYGDEAGLCGWTDPDNRRAYPWGKEDKELIALHQEMIRIHRESECLRRGSILFLIQEYGVIGYARFLREEKYIIICNNNDHDVELIVPVWRAGVTDSEELEQVIKTTEDGFILGNATYHVQDGKIHIRMPKYCSVVLNKC